MKVDNNAEINRSKYLTAKLKRLEDQREETLYEKDRMLTIMDVCGINNRLNGQWKNTLQQTDKNYNIAIADEQHSLEKLSTYIRVLGELIDNYKCLNQTSQQNHGGIMKEVKTIKHQQNNLSNIYENYEEAILEQSIRDEEKIKKDREARELEAIKIREANDMVARDTARRLQLELEYLQEEYERLYQATGVTMRREETSKMKAFTSSVREFKEDQVY